MSRYIVLPIPVDERTPEGYVLIVAYAKDDTVVIPMELNGLQEEDHNCDWEGCTTLNHVLRISPQQKYELDRTCSGLTAQVEELSSKLLNAEQNLERHQAILAGEWPDSIEMLEKALLLAREKNSKPGGNI